MKYKYNVPIMLYTAGILVTVCGMIFSMASLIFNNIVHDNNTWVLDIALVFMFAISTGEMFMHLVHHIKMIKIE